MGPRSQSSQYNHAAYKHDTRPLKDPAWRKDKAQVVVDFVKRQGWPTDRTLDVRSLCQCPSHSDVLFLLQFLINLVDAEYRLESLDGDAISNIFKRVLRYPYTIPVARKVVQITPLTWPAVFGAIVWLVERLDMDVQRINDDSEKGAPPCDDTNQFYMWVREMYQKVLWGYDDWRLAEMEMRQNLELQVREMQMENARTESEKKQLQYELQKLIDSPDDLETARKQRDALSQDQQNFGIYLARMKEWNSGKASAIDVQSRLTVELQRDVERLEQQKGHVVHLLQTQTLTKDEEERLMREKLLCNAQLAELCSRVKTTERGVEQVEQHLQLMMDKLEERVAEFNHAATLQKCYPGGKHTYGSDLKLEVNGKVLHASDVQDLQMLSVDPKTVIKPAIDRLQQRYQVKKQTVGEQLRVCQHEVKMLTAEKSEKMSTLETLREEVAAMDGVFGHAVQLHKSCQNLQIEIMNNQQKYHREKAQLCNAVSEGISHLLSYKDMIQYKLEKVHAECEAKVHASAA